MENSFHEKENILKRIKVVEKRWIFNYVVPTVLVTFLVNKSCLFKNVMDSLLS